MTHQNMKSNTKRCTKVPFEYSPEFVKKSIGCFFISTVISQTRSCVYQSICLYVGMYALALPGVPIYA